MFERKELKEFNPDELIEESYQQQADDLIDIVTEKPKWSEEDEYLSGETIQHLEELIRIDKVKHCACDVQYYQRDINWLKSLRPQPKPTWSEEDDCMLNHAIRAVSSSDYYAYDDKQELEKWLKSLKDRLK